MTHDTSRVKMSVLEGVTNVELRYPVGSELDLADGKVGLCFDHRLDVTFYVIGKQLIVIATEADKLPESEKAAYVPRHRTD